MLCRHQTEGSGRPLASSDNGEMPAVGEGESVVSLEEIARTIRGSARRCPSIVAIDGPGGAGKSTLARRLAALLPGSQVLSTDEFASWEVPLDWWPRLLEEVLVPLAEKRSATYRPYDWKERRLGEERSLVVKDHLILEGVSSGRLEFAPFLDFLIWLETPRVERLARGLQRDGEQMRSQWLAWMRDEDRHHRRHQTRSRADLIVSGAPRARHDPETSLVVLTPFRS